jgi:glycosyltransferase involved in cell wall biosynthesis
LAVQSMHDLRILLISSVLPRDTTGGEVILYRHFSQFPGLSLAIGLVVPPDPSTTDNSQDLQVEDLIEIQSNPILTRLKRTRLSKWIHDLNQCFDTFHDTQKIRNYIHQKKPDIILTIAHNELFWLAQKLSYEFNIPLVTFFHDWWPDMAYVHAFAQKILVRRFKQLYQRSKLVFCVNEEIRQALGTHPNTHILYPIPDSLIDEYPLVTWAENHSFTVMYAGTLCGIYGPMMQDLSAIVQSIPELNLKLFGPPLDWPNLLARQVKAHGIYKGFISRDLLGSELSNANALLVAMSFSEQDTMRMHTSFPSKIPEYCRFGKPIIIWGPEYSSAVRWGRKYQSALVVTSAMAQDLVKAIQELATQPEEQKRLGNKALEMAEGMFNPEKIQQQFVNSIYQVAAAQYKTKTDN